jgi:purine catabolism regulator
MNQNYQLTLSEIMDRPAFRYAYVAAGSSRMNRSVRWVHIIEVLQFEELLQGGEMILTTGAAFKTDTELFMIYMEQLQRRDVACLCLELGHYVNEVSDIWIETAEASGIPLIIFPQAVRFIEITQDIHAHIVNRHHHALEELERVSREFHRLTLTSQGVAHVLQLLHRSTKANVIYFPIEGQHHYFPALPESVSKRWMEWFKTTVHDDKTEQNVPEPVVLETDGQTVIVQPVGAMGKTWAFLLLVLFRNPSQHDYLILDSASLSIAQDLLRKRYMEERKLYSQTLWVNDLLHLRIRNDEEIKALIGSSFKRLNEQRYYVILIEFELENEYGRGFSESERSSRDEEEGTSNGIHLSLAVRSALEQQAFHPLITLQNNRLVVIAFDELLAKSARERLQHAFQALRKVKSAEELTLTIGVGQAGRGILNAYISYREAIQAISLSSALRSNSVFFEELGVYQLLFHIEDRSLLEAFIRSNLGPLIEHDQTRGSELLRTLKIYLDHDGSKQIAAQRLFIVRQSLYYRLDQIEQLLGTDYMQPEKRLALQVAIRAYQLLYPEIEL